MHYELESWADMLQQEFAHNGEDYSKMVTTLNINELNRKFNSGFCNPAGSPFTAWGEKYVYFPVVYDGAESVGSVPRDPCDIASNHFGGQ